MPAYGRWNLVLLTALLLHAASISAQTNEPWSGTYQYDGAGNVKAIGSNRYVYDGVMRLRQGAQQQFTYDAFGNLLTISRGNETLAAGIASTTNRTNDPGRCPQNTTCFLGEFDEGGNQTTFGSTTYAYDSANMMTELSAPGSDQLFVYDADDQRIATVVYGGAGSQTWHYAVRDLTSQVVREVDDVVSGSSHTRSWTKDYVRAGGRLFAAIDPDSPDALHFHLDHLGSPRLITRSGAIQVAKHTYWPFGTEAEGDVDGERMKFTGHERDISGDGNDLDYMHARYYSNVAGRFLSIDPELDLKLAMKSPQAWNRYAYVRNNPARWTDPTGRYTCDGTPRECQAIEIAMEKIRVAAAALKEQHKPGASILNRIVMMYGKLGDTGVNVVVQDNTGTVHAHADTDSSNNTTITLNRAFTRASIGTDGVRLAAALAHEGDHGSWQKIYGMEDTYRGIRQMERNAFRTMGYIFSYFNRDDEEYYIWRGFWIPGMVEYWGHRGAAGDCKAGCNP